VERLDGASPTATSTAWAPRFGISTDKLHQPAAPVGLEGLTTQKFVVLGHGRGRHLKVGILAGTFDPVHTRTSRWRAPAMRELDPRQAALDAHRSAARYRQPAGRAARTEWPCCG